MPKIECHEFNDMFCFLETIAIAEIRNDPFYQKKLKKISP